MKERAAGKVHSTVLRLFQEEGFKGAKVLDAAAGEGNLSFKIAKLGNEVYALDVDNEKLKNLKYILDLNPKLKTIYINRHDLNYPLPYKDNFFDAVISVETIEHLWNPFGFIRECYRVLKKRGVLIISTPNIQTIFSRLLFLFTGKFAGFLEKDYQKAGHITPISFWELEKNLN